MLVVAVTGPASYFCLRISSAIGGAQALRSLSRSPGGVGVGPCFLATSCRWCSQRTHFLLVHPASRQKSHAHGSSLDLRVGKCDCKKYSQVLIRLTFSGTEPLGLHRWVIRPFLSAVSYTHLTLPTKA